jgi:Family of unknown function (DUF6220)
MRRTATLVHRVLVGLWLLGAFLAFFLAGLGLFETTTHSKLESGAVKVATSSRFDPHRITGDVEILIALLILIAALVARQGRRHVGLSALLFGLMIVQALLAGAGVDNGAFWGGLHPVNGLIMIGLAFALVAMDRVLLARHPMASAPA